MKEESNNIKLNEINELRGQIKSINGEIVLLEKWLADPSDFLKLSSDKAVLVLSQTFSSESEKIEDEIKSLKIAHREKIFQLKKDILVEKVKIRDILSRLDGEINVDEPKISKALDDETYEEYLDEFVSEVEDIKLDASKVEASKIEDSKLEAIQRHRQLQIEASNLESSKIEESKVEDKKLEASKVEGRKLEASNLESSKIEESKVEGRKIEASKVEVSRKVGERFFDNSDLVEEASAPSMETTMDTETEVLIEEIKARQGFWEDDLYEFEEQEALDELEKEDIIDPQESFSKHAFIVGKFAGEALLDESGKFIIAKDEAITEEVVARAEAEGKLINLIVDMKIE